MAQRDNLLFIGADRFDASARPGLSLQAAPVRHRRRQSGGSALVLKEALQTIYVAALVAFAAWGFVG